MNNSKKGDNKMNTLTLKSIESKVRNNSLTRQKEIEEFTKSLRNRNMNDGRVRPKAPTETKILSMFSRK